MESQTKTTNMQLNNDDIESLIEKQIKMQKTLNEFCDEREQKIFSNLHNKLKYVEKVESGTETDFLNLPLETQNLLALNKEEKELVENIRIFTAEQYSREEGKNGKTDSSFNLPMACSDILNRDIQFNLLQNHPEIKDLYERQVHTDCSMKNHGLVRKKDGIQLMLLLPSWEKSISIFTPKFQESYGDNFARFDESYREPQIVVKKHWNRTGEFQRVKNIENQLREKGYDFCLSGMVIEKVASNPAYAHPHKVLEDFLDLKIDDTIKGPFPIRKTLASEVRNYGDVAKIEKNLKSDLRYIELAIQNNVGFSYKKKHKVEHDIDMTDLDLQNGHLSDTQIKELESKKEHLLEEQNHLIEKEQHVRELLAPYKKDYETEVALAFSIRDKQIKEGQYNCEHLEKANEILEKQTKLSKNDRNNTLNLLESMLWNDDFYHGNKLSKCVGDVYLFGSCLQSKFYKDVDILTRDNPKDDLRRFANLGKSQNVEMRIKDEQTDGCGYDWWTTSGEYVVTMPNNEFFRRKTKFDVNYTTTDFEDMKEPFKGIQVLFNK